jgi:hypothetical protein
VKHFIVSYGEAEDELGAWPSLEPPKLVTTEATQVRLIEPRVMRQSAPDSM